MLEFCLERLFLLEVLILFFRVKRCNNRSLRVLHRLGQVGALGALAGGRTCLGDAVRGTGFGGSLRCSGVCGD